MPLKYQWHDYRKVVTARYWYQGQSYVTQSDKIGPVVRDEVLTQPNIPGWKSLINNGLDATTYLIGTRHSKPKVRPCFYSFYYNTSGPSEGFGNPFTPPPLSVSVLPQSKALTRATQEFNKAYKRHSQSWQGGVFLGELREAVQFVRNPVRKLYDTTSTLADNIRRLKRRGNLALFPEQWSRADWQWYRKALSDLWLAYSFAAKPLANDANDACKALANVLNRRTFDVVKISGSGDDKTSDGVTKVYPSFTGIGNYLEADYEVVRKFSVTIRGAIRADVSPAARAPGQLGLGLFDVVPTLWELVPFSFLVDYFTNVGDCLDSLRLRYVDWAWLNRTVRNSATARVSDYRFNAYDNAVNRKVISGGSYEFTKTYVDRARTSPLIFSSRLVFEVPGLEKSSKWLNIAALVGKIASSKP